MTEYNTFDDYVKNVFNIEPSELTHISPQEQKNKKVEITVDELINIWNELTELKLKVDKSKWHFIKEKPATSLHLLANKELREELERLKKENEQLQIENKKLQCCGNCSHRNAEEVVETCRLLKKYTQIKGCCSEWESIAL